MAEQYASFYGKGPNVDVNLFPNAAGAGINAGNAQQTTTQSILGGIKDTLSIGSSIVGIANGVANFQGQVLNNDAQATQNEINSDPAVIEARKQAITAQSQLAQDQAYKSGLEAMAIQANEENYSLQQTSALETAAIVAQQVLGDTKNRRVIDKTIAQGNSERINSVLNDPAMIQTMARDPKYGMAAIAAMRGVADPLLLSSVSAKVDAVELDKRRMEMLGKEQELKQKKAVEFEAQASDAIAGLYSNPGLSQKKNRLGDKFNYQKMDIYPIDEVSVGGNGRLEKSLDGKTIARKKVGIKNQGETAYLMAYGDEVVDPYLSNADGKQNQKWLNNAKQYYSATDAPTPADDAPSIGTPSPVRTEGTGLAGMAGAAPIPTPGTTNQNVVADATKRNQQYFSQAQQSGNGGSYEALVSQGQNLGRPANMTRSEYLAPQSTPVAPGAPKITQPIPAETAVPVTDGSKEAVEKRVSQIVGAPVKMDVAISRVPQLSQASIDKVNSIAALDNEPAIMKGMAVVESEGNTDALASDGGAGLFQFMKPAAKDAGITADERFDPEKAAPAAARYFQIQYDAIEKKLNKTLAQSGLSVKPDPRMVLAAYNGGLRWIINGISAGNTTWPQMKQYLIDNKSTAAGRINTEYPDKVIMASVPFIKGGNASDDDYIKTLLGFGIIDV